MIFSFFGFEVYLLIVFKGGWVISRSGVLRGFVVGLGRWSRWCILGSFLYISFVEF